MNHRTVYYQTITQQAAQRLIAGGRVRILDVRDAEEYESGHLPGAIHIPLYQITRKAPLLLPSRQRPLLVYCGSGARSLPAVQVLSVMGYSHLYNLGEGIAYWPYGLYKETKHRSGEGL